jgi:glycosyltransferase involved in cell wall biosynthesis
LPPNNPSVVGLVGRLSIEKGVDIFLQASARVLLEFPSTRFVVAGEGPDRDKLESMIDELKIRGSVLMLGRRDDMPSVYASLDIMASASREEGLPIAILEGMASRLPIIATAVGEVPAIVLDGRTGILVPAKKPDSLATAIVTLLRNPDEQRRLGAAARKLIEDDFSARRMTDDYLRVYEEAASRRESK